MVLSSIMTRNKAGTEEVSKKLCIAITPSEYSMIEEARRAMTIQKGRNVTMRELFVTSCRVAFYDSDISKDKEYLLEDLMRSIAIIRNNLNGMTNNIDALIGDMYGKEDEE